MPHPFYYDFTRGATEPVELNQQQALGLAGMMSRLEVDRLGHSGKGISLFESQCICTKRPPSACWWVEGTSLQTTIPPLLQWWTPAYSAYSLSAGLMGHTLITLFKATQEVMCPSWPFSGEAKES